MSQSLHNSAGLIFFLFSKDFDYDGFQPYLCKSIFNKSSTTAKSTARDVNLYFRRAGGNNSDILNIAKLEQFIQSKKNPEELNFKQSNRKEKLYRLKFTIKFVRRNINNEQLYYRTSRVLDAIEEWCHGLSKDINILRKDHGLLLLPLRNKKMELSSRSC